MKYRLEHELDECLARLNGGEELEFVLAGFPDHADELRPLLAASEWMRDLVPPPTGKRERKAELLEAVAARRRLVEAAEGVVVEIKAGVPEDALLERCPKALHPVILAARTLRDAEPPWPAIDRRQAGKRRLMSMVERRRRERMAARRLSTQLGHRLGEGLFAGVGGRGPNDIVRRARTALVPLSLAAAVALAGTAGVAPAAASSLPGEPLYRVKLLGEHAELLMTFDPERRVNLRALHAQRRLDEMARLRAAGAEIPESVFENWLNGQSGLPNALVGLSSDQRQMLADVIERLGHRTDAEAVVAELQAIRDAEAKAKAETDAVSAPSTPAGYDWVTRPIARPLPEEPNPPADDTAQPRPVTPAQPPAAPIAEPPADGLPGAVQVGAPSDDQTGPAPGAEGPAAGGAPGAGGGAGSNPDPGAGSEPPGGIAPPSAGGEPTEPPPPFVQPPPAAEPPPAEPPGGVAP